MFTKLQFWEPCVSSFDRSNRIRTLLAKGIAAAEIARIVDCAPSTVYRIKHGKGARKGNRAAYTSVGTRLTERECAALDRLVQNGVGATRGAILRKLARSAGDYFDPNQDETVFLERAEIHLRALGGNFNQIAAALSLSVEKTGRADPSKDQIKAMREANRELQEIRYVVQAMLNNMQSKTRNLSQKLKADDGADIEHD